MPESRHSKRTIWRNIAGLFIEQRKLFGAVVLFSLLGTGANLLEPLIYREAINDITGLFLRQAHINALDSMAVQVPLTTDSVATDTTDVEGDSTRVDSEEEPDEESGLVGFIFSKFSSEDKEPHSRHHVALRTPGQAVETLLYAVVFIFIINLIALLMQLLGENMNLRLASRVEQNFIQRTFAHVLKLPLSFFSKRSSAALGKQINQSEEVSTVVDGFSQQVLPEIISLVGILFIMFWQNVELTALSLVIIPFYLVIAIRSANRLEMGLPEYYERWEEVSTRMQDALAGIKTVKLSGAEPQEVEQFRKISSEAYADYVRRNRLANQYVFWENLLTKIASALVLGVGGYLTIQRKITPGDVVMFVAYLDRLYTPIDNLTTLWVSMQQNVVSIARAFRLLHSGKEEKPGKPLVVPRGKIEFENVHFGYLKDRTILKGVSFTIEPGRVTAIVGHSGAGKTTTVDLIMKLYPVNSGRILIDGEDIAHADPSSLRSQIGMVSADGAIFRGSVSDNIRYKASGASEEEVKAAAHAAGLDGMLARLHGGLRTPIGESGFGLSVGERQRIQIARVLVAKPKILILDEATANLDYATEAEIKRTIDEVRKENTVVIIAHRFSMVRDADHVIVMDKGVISEQGSPAALIHRGGWFSRFAKAAEESTK